MEILQSRDFLLALIRFPKLGDLPSQRILHGATANMICQRCTYRLNLLSKPGRFSVRSISTTLARSSPSDSPPATSTSAAQPFSTPFTPSPSKTPTIPPGSLAKPQEPAIVSSVAAGTPLKGLGYIKGQEAPLAKEDNEYPNWLWGLLGTGTQGGEAEGEVGDAFGKLHLALLGLRSAFRCCGQSAHCHALSTFMLREC